MTTESQAIDIERQYQRVAKKEYEARVTLMKVREVLSEALAGAVTESPPEVNEALLYINTFFGDFDGQQPSWMPLSYVYRAQVVGAGQAINEALEAMSDQVRNGQAALAAVKTAQLYLANVFNLMEEGIES